MKPLLLAPLAALALSLLACGGSDNGAAATPSSAPATSPAATATQAPASATPAPSATPEPAAQQPPPPPPTSPPAPQPTTPPQPTAPPQPTSPPQPAGPVRLEVHALNLAFDKTELRARAGAQVTAVFQNDDTGIDHNLSFTVTGLPHGDTCRGPCTATQTFTAPAAGRFQFFCTIHSMLGDFIVDP